MVKSAELERTPSHLEMSELLRQSWEVFRRRPGLHLLCLAAMLLGGLFTLGLAFPALLVGYVQMIARLQKEEPVEPKDILLGLTTFGPATVAAAITVLAVGVGTALIVLPGVMVAVIWAFGLWFVAIEQLSGVAALSASARLVRQQTGSVLLLLVMVVGLNIIGIALVVGILVTAPMSMILMTVGFGQLNRMG